MTAAAATALAGLLGAWIWLVVTDQRPAPPPPAFADPWDDASGLLGEWDACTVDSRSGVRSNPCVLKFQLGPSGDLRVRAQDYEGGWTCWGRGTFADGRAVFEWTGPKGWRGTAEFTPDPDGRTMRGTFVRRPGGPVEKAVAEKRTP